MNRIEMLLTQAAEEAAEIGQAVSKILRFGPLDVNPTTGVENIRQLALELNDLRAVVGKLVEYGLPLNAYGLNDFVRVQAKQQKIDHYLSESVKLGRLDLSTAANPCPMCFHLGAGGCMYCDPMENC